MLLSQPEILKKMNQINKNKSVEVNTYSSKFVKKEQAKKQMKMKVEYAMNTQNTEARDNQVRKIIKEVDKTNKADDIQSIMNKDLNSQEENFKKRLEEKKKRSLLSTSDLTEQIETIKNKRYNLDKSSAGNKSFIIEGKNKGSSYTVDINITPEIEGFGNNFGINSGNNFANNNLPEDIPSNRDNFLQSLDDSFEKIDNKKIEEIDRDISFDTPCNESAFTVNNGRSQSVRGLKAPKHMQIFNDLKTNMDNFLSEFNYFFFEDVFTNVVEEIQKILEEKHKHTLEISKNYNNQIKEYECLITSGKILFYIFFNNLLIFR